MVFRGKLDRQVNAVLPHRSRRRQSNWPPNCFPFFRERSGQDPALPALPVLPVPLEFMDRPDLKEHLDDLALR